MRKSIFAVPQGAIAAALLVGALLFAGSISAWAGVWEHGNGGAEHDDWGADHYEIYQVQRGDLVCQSREACGGAAAIPMNRSGWFYLPGGIFLAQRPEPVAPVAPPHPKKKYRY